MTDWKNDSLTDPEVPGIRKSWPIWSAAIALSLLWLLAVGSFLLFADDESGRLVVTVAAVLLPIAIVWIGAAAVHLDGVLHTESRRLRSVADAVRRVQTPVQRTDGETARASTERKLDEIAAAQRRIAADIVAIAEGLGPHGSGVASETAGTDGGRQAEFASVSSRETSADPLPNADFIRALNFPRTEHDGEGFAALLRALNDPRTESLTRASQDVLTLLSKDGIYTDDLRPDRARPEIWRRFAAGERGRSVAALGGIHDRPSLALLDERMKRDQVFRDTAHHFLREFDKAFGEFEKRASDGEIAALADTRTARAFMMLARVVGTFS